MDAFAAPPSNVGDLSHDDVGHDAGDSGVDTGTLAWLLPEIASAFDASTTALRAFRAQAAGLEKRDVDFGPLRIARSHLHQAHGALEMGEIAGVTRLTEAVEALLATFEVEPDRCDATAIDAIGGGCRALIEYLEDLQGGAPQQPLYLFASYRELLVARGVDRIHPADLFHVDRGVRPPRTRAGAVLDHDAMQEQRGHFEQALLRYMRDDRDASALAVLADAVTAIEGSVAHNAKQSQQRAFWWVARALFEAIAHGGFDGDGPERNLQQAHLKRLAGRINLQIRKLVEGSTAVSDRLLCDTLFFVAIAKPVTPHVRAVRTLYRLEHAVPDDFERQRYGRIDAAVLRTAREVLAAAKTVWSAVVAGDLAQIKNFARETGALLDTTGSIGRRGLAQVAQIIDGIATDLGFDPRQPTAAVGLDVATALLFVEGALERARWLDDAFDDRAALVVARLEASALAGDAAAADSPAPAPVDWLDRMSRAAEDRQTMAAFVGEMQANLRNAEKCLDAFFRDAGERAGLKEAQKSLAQVSGALALLGHADAHRAIDRALVTIDQFLAEDAEAEVDGAAYERLAESLGAVGFYVDQVKRERIEPGAFRFDAETGALVADIARPPAVAIDDAEADEVEPYALPQSVTVVDFEIGPLEDETTAPDFAATEVLETTFEDEIARRGEDANALVAELRIHPEDDATRDRLVATLEDVRRTAELIDDRSLQDEASAAIDFARDTDWAATDFAATDVLGDRVAELASHANRLAHGTPPAIALEAPAPVPAADNVAAVDAELLEIFLEEAGTVLADAEASLKVLDADPESSTAFAVLRRNFHTLKGSGRMVGLTAFGDAAWAIEDTLASYIADERAAPADLRALIDYAIRYLNDWVAELTTTGSSSRIPDALVEAARAVRSGMSGSEAPPPAMAAVVDDFQKTDILPPQSPFDDFAATLVLGEDDDDRLDIAFFGSQPVAPVAATEETLSGPDFSDLFPTSTGAVPEAAAAPAPAPAPVEEPEAAEVERREEVRRIGNLTLSVALFNIYLSEADELLRVLTQDFAEWRHELDRYVSDGAMRAAHSLAGSSATVGLMPAHDLASAVEEVLQTLWREPVVLVDDQVTRLQDAVEALRRMLHRFAAERMPEPDPVRIAALVEMKRELAEGARPTEVVPAAIEPLPFEPLDFGDAPVVARDAPEPDEVEVEAVAPDTVEVEAVEPMAIGPAAVAEAAPEFVAEVEPEPVTEVEPERVAEVELVAEVEPELVTEPEPEAEPVTEAEPEPAAEADPEVEPVLESTDAPTIEAVAGPVPVRTVPVAIESGIQDDIDPELLDVFVQEGGEILPQIGGLLRAWQGRPNDSTPARTLLRHLHTLKGSARMAGAMRLGEVVHDIEARVESAARLHEVPATLLDELLGAHDRSLELFDRLQHPAAVPAPAVEAVAPIAAAESVEPADPSIEQASPAVPRPREAKSQSQQQVVRVNSETLDRLVNLAGEISISRARIDNEVTQIKVALTDLNENVERMRAQLREIELQAEFQMQSQMQSQQTSGQEREKFDPLEFDRFTRFQELTRMMAESVNDVKTLQNHLQKSLESAETDLSSQRRMTRDLQQDLMRVRMVPFASIAERLYRVARRAAKELDKRVNLDIRGGSVEIDRSVLERMAGPFEHLLRNHIVHGIESRAARRDAGKDETGELLVEVRQEGNEIVLTFSDDGAGLDHDRIRAKGRELGLITPDETVADAAAAELIFHPGFSTASEVTELAGRGVGMDVVREEAMVLAGRVSVDSEPGRGTRFTINLPLTLAVTQVVLVTVAGRVYALPAVLVEQVQQLRPQPLADAYRAGHLEWDGQSVRLAFLGTLLGIDDSVPVAQRTSPVLILRSAGERIAIHVDDVIGNQEVVVKNLGPQLSRMTGIAGATVLGSGQIVLILNPVQLAQVARPKDPVRGESVVAPVQPPAEGETLKTLPTVMVVDDSLTVRRVTQRLLSREGYQVVLAKDGVDALEQLQDFPPDAMLVDIEMPRMDGFDLTRNVRNDPRYKDIPIIMITSRTAEKHRQHAAELGVDEYLGKPYQEDELLELLARHVGVKRPQSA